MENRCILIFFSRIFYSCKPNARTSTRFLERFRTQIISFNGSPVNERCFSELGNIHHVYITVYCSPFSGFLDLINPNSGTSTLYNTSLQADGVMGI